MSQTSTQRDYERLLDATRIAVRSVVAEKEPKAAAYLDNLVERLQPGIYGEFKGICNLVNVYMDSDKGLDRHKRSACHMIALMYKLQLDPEYECYRERLAIWAGLAAMEALILAGDSKNPALEAFLIKNKMLGIPGRVNDHDNHIENLALRLRKACEKEVDKGILALFLSSELFLIESYNIALAEGV